MFIDDSLMYKVLERCLDLFPEWMKEGENYYNVRTGEILIKDWPILDDCVLRGNATVVKQKILPNVLASDVHIKVLN